MYNCTCKSVHEQQVLFSRKYTKQVWQSWLLLLVSEPVYIENFNLISAIYVTIRILQYTQYYAIYAQYT